MEVNFIETGTNIGPNVRSQRPASKVKGTWKAKRRELLKTRGPRKRVRPEQDRGADRDSARAPVKLGRTARLAQDEFSSGANDSGRSGATESAALKKSRDIVDSDAVKKRKISRTQASTASDGAPAGPDHAGERPTKRRTLGTAGNPPQEIQRVSPAQVAATLGVMRGSSDTALEKSEVEEGTPIETSDTRANDDEYGIFGLRSFDEIGLYASVSKHLVHRMGITRPTRIQQTILETLLGAKDAIDVLVRSETGSGKTLGYCIPMAHFLLNRQKRVAREAGSVAIILVPTRELAEQVEDVASRVFRPWHWIVVGSVRGGENRKHEKDRLRKGVSVLVGTPGRLLDHIRNTRSFQYSSIEFLVLDEADRLLDLGFEADIKECIQSVNAASSDNGASRCNILLSATLNRDVQRLADFSLKDPVEVSASTPQIESPEEGRAFSMPTQLRQHYCVVEQKHRLVALAAFLRLRALKTAQARSKSADDTDATGAATCKIIVFFSSCDSVDFHHELFTRLKLPSELARGSTDAAQRKFVPLELLHIHGARKQADRVQALRAFRKSQRAVLFCTDVAARGLDLKGVSLALQYDPPTGGAGEELEYLHRAGRTARIGEAGDAVIFLLPSEKQYVKKIEAAGASVSEISANTALAALRPGAKLSSPEDLSYSARLVTSAVQEAVEAAVKGDEKVHDAAVAGYRAYCRAYATHSKDVKHFFHVRNLHLGHVARAFGLVGKPAELNDEFGAKAVKEREEAEIRASQGAQRSGNKSDIARAIAEGTAQPFNDQRSTLAKRRREGGRGTEAYKELASEFNA